MRSEKMCLFARQAPEIDREGDMFFLSLGGDHADIGVRPHVLQTFHRRLGKALAAWEAERREPIPIRDHAASS